MKPGEIRPADATIEINVGRPKKKFVWPIQETDQFKSVHIFTLSK